MQSELLVPRLNTNDDEVDIVHWYFNDRDYVEKGQEIVDLESSKAVVSIESEASGYLLRHSQKGDTVAVGAPLATVYAEIGELEAALDGGKPQIAPVQIASEVARQPVAVSAAPAIPPPLEQRAPITAGKEQQPTFNFTRFSKSAQDYIARNQLDLGRFEGMGLVSVEVIETALGIRQPLPTPLQDGQKLVAPAIANPSLRSEKVGKSKQLEISLLTAGQSGGINSSLTVQFNSARIRQTLEETGSLNGQILPLILFELAQLLPEYPAFTAYYQAGQIYYYDRIDLGLAIDLGKGLKVPVIRSANQLMPAELLEAITDFATRYLDNQLAAADLVDGTITVSDLSNEQILHFQPLLNQNQSVILGIGGDSSIADYPMTLTIVFDHRILAGREVAQFLNTMKKRLLNYELTALPTIEQAVRVRDIHCSRCLIDLDSLYKKFGKGALMHVHVDEQGQAANICHLCVGGF